MISTLVCGGCGHVAPPTAPYPFRCPAARPGDDVDHVLTRRLAPSVADGDIDAWRARFLDPEPNPFLRYRTLFHAHETALAAGMSDADYVALVTQLDEAVAGVDGQGFRVTPCAEHTALAGAVGWNAPLRVKDETQNVSGSHKGRHLMGIMIWLRVMETVGRIPAADRDRPLAIASCGNAALAAAVVAKAAGRRLDVFIPPDANPGTVARLRELGATLTVCPRDPRVPGDPTYLRFRHAVSEGALPFTCQGNENGLTIEGGKTLGWEIVSRWLEGTPMPDAIYLHVGGGALASATIQSLKEAYTLGLIERLPTFHTVQTASCHPLRDAHAALLGQGAADHSLRERLLHDAATHRSRFMRPWPTPPHSVAHGILDDETYDWLEIVRGLLETGGTSITVDEATLNEAHDIAHATTTINVCHTGVAGLAGVLHAVADGSANVSAPVAVLFTGRER